jgi:hypothetical protein
VPAASDEGPTFTMQMLRSVYVLDKLVGAPFVGMGKDIIDRLQQWKSWASGVL